MRFWITKGSDLPRPVLGGLKGTVSCHINYVLVRWFEVGRNSTLEDLQDNLKWVFLIQNFSISWQKIQHQEKKTLHVFHSFSTLWRMAEPRAGECRWSINSANADGQPQRPRSICIDMFLKGQFSYLSTHCLEFSALNMSIMTLFARAS